MGENRFAAWQESRVSERFEKIKKYLAVLKRTKANYLHVTALADAVAEHLSTIDDTPCNKTTLLRNSRYKSLLLDFLANQRGAIHVPEEALPDDRAKSVVLALQLEVRNLKEEKERLLAHVADLDAQLEEVRGEVMARPPSSTAITGPSEVTGIETLENHLGLSCKTIWLILDHFSDIVSVDESGKRIVDLSGIKGRNTVVDEKTAEPFFNWLRKNRSIGK